MDLSVKIIVGILLSLITLASVFGNILVCLAIFREKTLRITCNFYILSLAIADLLVSLIVFPLSTGLNIANPPSWLFGLFSCFLFIFADVMFCTASILNLCAIAVDRYRAIATPMSYAMNRSPRMTFVVTLVCWCISVMVSLVMVIIFRKETILFLEMEMCALPSHPAFVIISSIISFFLPCAVMIGLYVKIIQVMRTRSGWKRPKISSSPFKSPKITPHESQQSSSSSNANNTVKTQDNENRENAEENFEGLNERISRQGSHMRMSRAHTREDDTGSIVVHANKKRAIVSKERKAAKTLGIVMLVFVLCWMPYFCGHILNSVCCELSFATYQILTWLGYANSALNPLLYTMFNPEFRAAFKKIVFCKKA